MAELFGMQLSPFTEKARWALDHHRLKYRFVPYVPMLGEPLLRVRLRKPFGRVSVPVFFDDEGHGVGDSFAIAKHVDDRGLGAPLLGSDTGVDVEMWNARSETALDAGRTVVMPRLASEAREDALPPFVPESLKPRLAGIAGVGFSFVNRKYGVPSDVEPARARLASSLGELRNALANRPYLGERFSFADVAMAAVLQFVDPVRDAFVRLGARTRRAMHDEDLSREFADLLSWRDALYAKHRKS